MAENSTGKTIRSHLRFVSDIFARTFWKQNKLFYTVCQAGWTLPFTSLRKPFIFSVESFNPTGKPNNWRKNSFDSHVSTSVPVLTTVPLLRQVKFCVQWKVSRKDAKACSITSFASQVLRIRRPGWKTHRKQRKVPEKRAQTHKKNTRKS